MYMQSIASAQPSNVVSPVPGDLPTSTQSPTASLSEPNGGVSSSAAPLTGNPDTAGSPQSVDNEEEPSFIELPSTVLEELTGDFAIAA